MYKREIIKKEGKIYEVIYQDAELRHKNINYIADYNEKVEKPVTDKKKVEK